MIGVTFFLLGITHMYAVLVIREYMIDQSDPFVRVGSSNCKFVRLCFGMIGLY